MSKRKCPYLEYEWCYDCDGEEFKEKICPIEQYYKGEIIKCYCSTEYKECITYNLKKEIDRLNNIIDELEKELDKGLEVHICNGRNAGKSIELGYEICQKELLRKLQELKNK